jgi:hypothetical protein
MTDQKTRSNVVELRRRSSSLEPELVGAHPAVQLYVESLRTEVDEGSRKAIANMPPDEQIHELPHEG